MEFQEIPKSKPQGKSLEIPGGRAEGFQRGVKREVHTEKKKSVGGTLTCVHDHDIYEALGMPEES